MGNDCEIQDNKKEFDNQVVLVTGAGGGIGRVIAATFAEVGARVMVNGRHKKNIEETAALLRPKSGDRVATYAADVRFQEEMEAMVAETARIFGHIDILVNNAGLFPNKRVVEMSEEEWDLVMDTNVKGPFLLSKIVAMQMIERGKRGRIINISSVSYRMARPGAAHYASSKAALVMLTQVMAIELADYGITVNSVCPGLTDHGRNRATDPVWDKYCDAYIKTIPAGRIGRPDEIARAVLFLASKHSEYIIGSVLTVDGGVLAGKYGLPPNK